MGSQRLKQNHAFKLVVTLLHLAFWAELGVLTRVFCDKFFEVGCDGGWGPCLDGGIYYKDLPSNMLGCFVIGLFAASSTLGLKNDKTMALLPREHSWQNNFEVQIGIRTGYCGSLTTFASWALELIIMATDNQWANMIMAFAVGIYVSIFSYILGTHAALYVDRWFLKEDVLEVQAAYRDEAMGVLRGELPPEERAEGHPTSDGIKGLQEFEPDLPTLQPSLRLVTARRLGSRVSSSRVSAGGLSRRHSAQPSPRAPIQLELGAAGQSLHRTSRSAAAAAAAAGVAEEGQAGDKDDGKPAVQEFKESSASSSENANGSANAPHAGGAQQEPPLVTFMGNKTDFVVLVGLIGMTALFAMGVGLETRHKWLRQIWFECMLGPFGCILRWYLSRWNYKLPGSWAWFPAGTWAANMLGCSIDFAIQCVITKVTLGYWASLILPGIQTGFCGSLTTVSTFVTEVVKFAELFPESATAYAYTLISIVGGALLGVTIFGWAVWTS